MVIQQLTRQKALQLLKQRLAQNQKTLLAFANTNLVHHAAASPQLQNALKKFILLNDGIGLSLGVFIATGKTFPHNLNGTDFIPALLTHLQKPRVFLYGSTAASVQKAGQVLHQKYGATIAGTHNGYSKIPPQKLIQKINTSKAQILLVALGNPAQEFWLAKHAKQLKPTLCIGVGALFDYLSGHKFRAPQILRMLKLEWLFRLASEPRRLGKRYTRDALTFFRLSWQWRTSRSSNATTSLQSFTPRKSPRRRP